MGSEMCIRDSAVPPKRRAFTAAARLDVGDFGDNDVDRSLASVRGHKWSRERPRTAGDRQSLRVWRHVRPDPFGKSLGKRDLIPRSIKDPSVTFVMAGLGPAAKTRMTDTRPTQ